ncbi:hypothetical protein [Lysinibacillus parviboronicapiens]|uniref:hypothetical protein n=1 Tax=Lysinibacillus parviboronicapiens TaxID=436516 RepID=UPI000D36BE74|nr:hypothetical protein [Lysinibacillus parviboronicapiens]
MVALNIVKRKTEKDKVTYCKRDLELYVEKVDEILEKSVQIKEISFILSGIKFNRNLYNKIYKFIKTVGLEEISLPLQIQNKSAIRITKDSIEKFENEYISLGDAYLINGMYSEYAAFNKYLKRENIVSFEMLKFNKAIFIKKSDLDKLISIDDVIEIVQVLKEMNLPRSTLYIVIKQHNIQTIRGFKKKVFLKKEDAEKLVKYQSELIEQFENEYYDLHKIIGLVRKEGLAKEKGELLSSFTKKEIPEILRIPKYKNKSILYSKKEVDNYLEELRFNNNSKKILLDASLDNYEKYISLIEFNGINIESLNNLTWNEWFNYIKGELKYLKKNISKTKNKIIQLKNVFITLYQFIGEKEVFEFKYNEIKLALFSDTVPIVYRMTLRTFLNRLNKMLIDAKIKPINTTKLIEVSDESFKRKEIFGYEEYKAIYNVISDYNRHLDFIVKNNIIMNKESLYIEFWIYSLLHIFTGLRSQNALDYKLRVEDLLAKYSIDSIEQINEKYITEDLLNSIISYICSATYIHTKNGSKALIYCPDLLKRSFAYSVILYQLKKSTVSTVVEDTIVLEKNYFSKNIIKDFFGELEEFHSKKMTKTLMTVVNEIEVRVSEGTYDNTSKFLRGHKDKSNRSTMSYLVITQDRLDEIILENYDTGFFGYLYENLVEFIKAESNDLEFKSKSVIINEIKSVFGDTLALENIIQDIQKLVEIEVSEFVDLMKKKQLVLTKNDFHNVVTRANPSKAKNISCLFKDCVDKQRDCENCIFHIPHFYSVNQLIKRLYENIDVYISIEYEEGLPAYKIKIYNSIIRDLKEVMMFVKKFGKPVIEYIMGEQFEVLKSRLLKLNKPTGL